MAVMIAMSIIAMAQQPVDWVNPIIGTNGMGHTFPGACTPFGLVQLSPDTDTIPHNVKGAYQKNAQNQRDDYNAKPHEFAFHNPAVP